MLRKDFQTALVALILPLAATCLYSACRAKKSFYAGEPIIGPSRLPSTKDLSKATVLPEEAGLKLPEKTILREVRKKHPIGGSAVAYSYPPSSKPAILYPVLFAYNDYLLSAQAREQLKINAEWLNSNSEIRVFIAGHCDQRGTSEYNLALGQRRAKAVGDFYTYLGVDSSRINLISYGKERPLCKVEAESCYLLNRRVESAPSY